MGDDHEGMCLMQGCWQSQPSQLLVLVHISAALQLRMQQAGA